MNVRKKDGDGNKKESMRERWREGGMEKRGEGERAREMEKKKGTRKHRLFFLLLCLFVCLCCDVVFYQGKRTKNIEISQHQTKKQSRQSELRQTSTVPSPHEC